MPQKHKRTPSQLSAPQRKEPPVRPRWLQGAADEPAGSHPSWKLSRLDLEHAGSWSWDVTGEDLREIVQFLGNMERSTWNEVRGQLASSKRASHRKHHSIPVERLCSEAQRRLQDLKLDPDELFGFRLSGSRRLWGAVDDKDGAFYVVWWDPDHQVYPLGRD